MKKGALIFIIIMSVSILFGAGAKETASSKTVLIYSPQSETDLSWIREAAKEELDFKIDIMYMGGGDLADRLIAERKRPQADVVFGIVPLSMYQLKNEGLLVPYTPSWTKGLPEAFQDSEHYFHSFWQTPIVLAYNPKYLSPVDAPKSWLDVTKDIYKGKYSIGPTSGQTVRTYLSGIIWRFYDPKSGTVDPACWTFLRKLFENRRSFPAGDAYYQEVARGDMPLILNWLGGIELGAQLNNFTVNYINSEGGTPVIAEAIALVKKDTINENAQKFIDWFGSPELQARMSHDLGKAPAHPEALAKAPEAIRANLSLFTPQNIDWGVIAGNIYDWLEKIELEIIP